MAKSVTPSPHKMSPLTHAFGRTFWRRRAHLADLAFLSLLAFTVATRLLRLSSIPAVYPDEANFIEFSHQLLRGHFEWGIFSHTFLPRLPLPLLAMGIACQALGANLFAIRLVCALVGILTALATYFSALGGGKRLALLAFLFLAADPFVVCYNRWGLTYNFLPLFGMLALGFALRPVANGRSDKPAWGLALCVAGALLCEPLALALFLYGFGVILLRRKDWLLRYVLVSLAPLGLYLVYLWLAQGTLLFSDIEAILGNRLQAGLNSGQEPALAVFAQNLIHAGGWRLLWGLAALLALPTALRRHALALSLCWLALLYVTAKDDFTLLVRELIVLYPLAALGWSALAIRVLRRAGRIIHHDLGDALRVLSRYARLDLTPGACSKHARTLTRLLSGLGLACGIYWLLILPARFILDPRQLKTPLDYLCIGDVKALDDAGSFLAQRTGPSDLVLGDHLTRLLPCRKSTLMQMAVAEGAQGNPFFPYETFRDRRLGPWQLGDVKYVLLTPYNFTVEPSFPGVAAMLKRLEGWPKVFESGPVRVLMNPQMGK